MEIVAALIDLYGEILADLKKDLEAKVGPHTSDYFVKEETHHLILVLMSRYSEVLKKINTDVDLAYIKSPIYSSGIYSMYFLSDGTCYSENIFLNNKMIVGKFIAILPRYLKILLLFPQLMNMII